MPSWLMYVFSFSACCSTDLLLAPPSESLISADLYACSQHHYRLYTACTAHASKLLLFICVMSLELQLLAAEEKQDLSSMLPLMGKNHLCRDCRLIL